MTICKLCVWLTQSLYGDDGTEFNRWAWERSDDWDRSFADTSKLWEKEPDRARASEAFAILQSDPDAGYETVFELADQGSTWAMQRLATAYEHGWRVAPDLTKSMEWYRQAMAAGSWFATIGYARVLTKAGLHSNCEKVLKDGVKKGYVPAEFWLAWYRLKLSKSRKTYLDAEPLLEKAASEGHPAAQRFLALYMLRGKFGLRKIPRGMRLLRAFTSNFFDSLDAEKTTSG